MVLDALRCIFIRGFWKEIVNDNIVPRCVYYLPEITTRTNNLKNTVLLLIDLQSNPPKRPQFTANDVEGVMSH